jgi:hypothetical protein
MALPTRRGTLHRLYLFAQSCSEIKLFLLSHLKRNLDHSMRSLISLSLSPPNPATPPGPPALFQESFSFLFPQRLIDISELGPSLNRLSL